MLAHKFQELKKTKFVPTFKGSNEFRQYEEVKDENGRGTVKCVHTEKMDKYYETVVNSSSDLETMKMKMRLNLQAARQGNYQPDEMAFDPERDLVPDGVIPESIHEVYQAQNKLKSAYNELDDDIRGLFNGYEDFVNAITTRTFTTRVTAALGSGVAQQTQVETKGEKE